MILFFFWQGAGHYVYRRLLRQLSLKAPSNSSWQIPPFYIPLAAVNIYRLLIQGMGYSKIAMFAGVCEMVARSFAGLVLVPVFGYTAACFANPLAWVMADVFLIPCIYTCCVRQSARKSWNPGQGRKPERLRS